MTEDEEINAVAILQVAADQINAGNVDALMLVVVDNLGQVSTLSTENAAVFNDVVAMIAESAPKDGSFVVSGPETVQ